MRKATPERLMKQIAAAGDEAENTLVQVFVRDVHDDSIIGIVQRCELDEDCDIAIYVDTSEHR